MAMKDPVFAAYDQQLADDRARAGDVSPEALAAYGEQLAARAAARRQQEAAATAPARPDAMGLSAPAQAAHLAYNPQTQTVLVNGQPLPHDVAVWRQAATADPTQFAPMSVQALRQYGFHPITQEDLAGFLGKVQQNAEAPVMSNLGNSLVNGLDQFNDALVRAGAYTGELTAKGLHAIGADGIADHLDASNRATRALSARIQQSQAARAQQAREGLTFEEQAGNDAGFLEHPGTYLASKGASFAGAAGPAIAGMAVNPALGAGFITAQSAGGAAQDAEVRLRTAIEHMSPADLAAQSPTYAQLRQQGVSDTEAREQLVSSAGDTAGALGGAIGAATLGVYDLGGRGISALAPRLSAGVARAGGDSFVAKALTGRGVAGLPLRAGVRGLEGASVMQGQMMASNAAAAGATGVGSTDPTAYFDPQSFQESLVGFGAMGAFARMPPQARAAASDIGAAARAIEGNARQPTVETPEVLQRGLQPGTPLQPQGDIFGRQEGPLPQPVEAPQPVGRVVDPRQLPIDFQQVGQNADMFGPPSAPHDVPAEPAPMARAPFNPDQLPLDSVPDIGPAQGPRGQLIRQRMMERRAAAQPQGEPAALPPLGPTQGMSEHAASLQQSLDLVTNMLEAGNFNKRTKAGKATIARLQSEQQRLQGELEAAQNDVAGAEIGAARAARPEPQGVSLRGDPQSGQLELPIGQEPSGDPRLTGQELPPAARPGDSVEPPPLPNPEPMSPQEAQARLATQRARRPERQAPQGDLFPRELKRGLQERIAQGEQADNTLPVPETTPEPAVDLQAQADALGKSRDALFVAAGNEAQTPKVKRGVRKVVRDEGTLFTTSAAKARAYRSAPQVNDALLARLQGLNEAKGEAMAKGDTGVVAAEDAQGRVVKEAVGEANAPAVEAAVPKGGKVVRRSAQAAQARRANLVAEQPTKRSRADQLKDKAAAKAASNAATGKKKVAAEPITPEELTAPAEPAPARVKAARETLVEDVRAHHPHLLDEADLQPRDKTGAGRDHIPAVARLPLTDREFGALADRVHATAQAEAAAPTWSARKSVIRRVLDMLNLPTDIPEVRLRQVVRDIAGMEPGQLRQLLARMSDRIVDQTLAKGIVRGMDVVRDALATQDNDPRGRAGVRETDAPNDAFDARAKVHLMAIPTDSRHAKAPALDQARSTTRVKLYGTDLPGNVVDVVGRWLHILDRDSDVMPRTVHLMTPDEAGALYGTKTGIAGVSKQLSDGSWVIAVDFKRLPEPAAVEALAHEVGHVVSKSMFDKATPEEQRAVRAAFEDWQQVSGRGTPTEQMLSRVPPALGDLIRQAGHKPERAYAESWNEWTADETAKWLLTSRKPKSAVDRFFSRVAEALSKLYAQIEGRGRPTEAVREMLDNFASRNRDLAGDDAAARAGAMNYGRDPAEAPRPAELARARIDARAMARRMELAVNGAMDLRDQARTAFTGRPEDLRRSVNTAIKSVSTGKLGDVVRRTSFALSNMNDMVGRYGGKEHGEFGAGFTLWDHVLRLAEKYGREAQQAGQLALERAQRLSAPVSHALEDLMYKSTVYGVHPDAPFGKGKNAHLRDEDPEVEASNARRYGEVRDLWDQLAGLQGNPHKVFLDLHDAMRDLHTKTFEARRENIDSLDISAEAKEEGHRQLNLDEERMLEGPYFPLVREGSYITVARLPAASLGRFATRAEAEQAGRRYKAMNPHAEIMPVEDVDGEFIASAGEKAVYFHDSLKDARAAKAAILEELREAWHHEGLNLDDAESQLGPQIEEPMTAVEFYRKAETPTSGAFMKAVNKLHDGGHMDPQAYQMLAEMYVESLPEASPRKAYLQRENIRGANRRMLAGYARRLQGAAHSYGQTKIAPQRNKAWAQMLKHRGDRPEYGQVMSDLQHRQEVLAKRMVHSPVNTVSSVVQDASSFMSLAFAPAFHLQQALQPLMLSAPVLAARMGKDGKAVGYARTMDALSKSYEGAASFFLTRGGQQFVAELKRAMGTYGGDGLTLQESATALIEKFGRTEDERDMLRYMYDRGTLDFSFLNAVNDAVSHTAFGAKAKAVMRLSMAFAQQLEAMNRTVTGLAAYRLAREARGMDHADAVREANAVVSQTHGDYSRYNRPSVFNRPLVGIGLQFKMYTQFMYSLLVSNFAHALHPRTQGERAQSIRTLAYVLASHATLGGVVGLGPVAGAAKLALGALMYAAAGAGLIDKKKKDQTLSDWIAAGTEDWGDEMFGKGAGKTLRTVGSYGLPAAIGLDLADKIAIPDITDTRFTGRARADDQPGDRMDRAVLTALGPVYSNAKRMANGVGDLFNGDLPGAANQMLPAAPRAFLHAATEAQDGVVTRSGTVVRPREDMSPYDTAVRALGLQPVKTAMAYDDRARVQSAIDRVQAERSDLLRAYREADPEDRSDVTRDIDEFNRGRAPELQISRAALQRALKPQTPSKLEQAAKRAVE